MSKRGSWVARRRLRTGQRHRSIFRLREAPEQLETRRVLAAAGAEPAIQGLVFGDTNLDGIFDAGEELSGVELQLFLDDGDGIFDPNAGDTQVGSSQFSDANGEYCFDNLDSTPNFVGTTQFFVVQPSQMVGDLSLSEIVSGPISPGLPDLVIDDFDNPGGISQEVVANPTQITDASTLFQTDETHVIGQERDLFAEFISGTGEVELRADAFDSDRLQFATGGGVQGTIQVIWDGDDMDAGTITMGLNGRDLTEGNVNEGIGMQLGVDASGSSNNVNMTIRLYQGSSASFSEVTTPIPTTDGTATEYLFVPFTDFTGSVSPTNVDAIELIVDGSSSPSFDGELLFLGALAPKTANFSNPAGADLSITKTNDVSSVIAGDTTTYGILVENLGPNAVTGATVTDVFDTTRLTNVSYTSSVLAGTASGNTSGNGDIMDTVNMNSGAQIFYTVTGTVLSSATGNLDNTATVDPPTDVADPDLTNNSATDSDPISADADLAVTKANGVDSVTDGDTVVYTIVVSNGGPSDIVGGSVTDVFPTTLTNVVVTTAANGGASISASNSDATQIDDTVDVPVGGAITYTVTGTLNAGMDTTLSNTVDVQVPQGVTDFDPSNNTAVDTDPILQLADLSITKSNGVSSVGDGDAITYTILVENNGPNAVVGATVSDIFPLALTGASIQTATQGAATITNSNSDSTGIDDTVDMSPGSSITYTVTGTLNAGTDTNLANTAAVQVPTGVIDPDLADNTATDDDPINRFDLAITKTNNVDSVVPGEVVNYQIVVTNDSDATVTDALIDDVFPATLQNVSFTSTTTGNVSGNTDNGTGPINDVVTMDAGSTITYAVQGTVDSSATGTLSNTATVTAPSGIVETDLSNNSANDADPLSPEVDLVITKSANLATISPGDVVTYTISATNDGPSDVVAASITDFFSSEFSNISFTSVAAGGASGNTTSGSGDISDTVNIPANDSITYTVTATVSTNAAPGQLDNTASIAAPTNVTESDVSNNDDTVSITVTDSDAPNLSITKQTLTSSLVAGEQVQYEIIVSNIGNVEVQDAQVSDLFPAELQGISFTSTVTGTASGNTSNGSGSISDQVTMSPGSEIRYAVTANIANSANGNVINTATVTMPSGVTDIDETDNQSTVTDPIVESTDLAITKTNNEFTVESGGPVTYVITVTNNGPTAVVGASLVDDFSDDFENVSFTSSATGGASGNSPSGNGDISETVNLPVGSSVTYTVDADVIDFTDDDEVVNTATITTPDGVVDSNPDNNSAADIDPVDAQEVDLRVTKTNNVTSVTAGDSVTYEIVVSNVGANDVDDVDFTDDFPVALENVNFTSSSLGGASGNSSSGNGNINDTLNLPVDSSVTYSVTGTVADDATGDLINTADVRVPTGSVDINESDNSDTDSDTIRPVDAVLAELSGFVYLDLDNDGVFDDDELPISAVDIVLEELDGDELSRTTTDENGAYSFVDLDPATYVVREIQPVQFNDGIDSVGGGIGVVSGNDQFTVTLAAGDNATELNFGERIRQASKRDLLASRFAS